jgi:hypothetical protein
MTSINVTTLVRCGTPPFTITSTALPGGLTLSGGVVSGTPTVSGSFSPTFTVTDARSQTATTTACPITIVPRINGTCPTATGVVNSLYSFNFAATLTGGVGPFTCVAIGSLPPGTDAVQLRAVRKTDNCRKLLCVRQHHRLAGSRVAGVQLPARRDHQHAAAHLPACVCRHWKALQLSYWVLDEQLHVLEQQLHVHVERFVKDALRNCRNRFVQRTIGTDAVLSCDCD